MIKIIKIKKINKVQNQTTVCLLHTGANSTKYKEAPFNQHKWENKYCNPSNLQQNTCKNKMKKRTPQNLVHSFLQRLRNKVFFDIH